MGHSNKSQMPLSHAYPTTHPEYAHTIAQLFGLGAAKPARAKVLEIGCGSGGNLIPLAGFNPQMKCVGIDSNAELIKKGVELCEASDLTNITLTAESIEDFKPKPESFDYIICHGVYSWVDEATQSKLLSLIQMALKPKGVALVGFNTLPGWLMPLAVRNMMRYHTKQITDTTQKVSQARALMQFMVDSLEGDQSAWAEFLRSEIKIINGIDDAFLVQEYLEENNQPHYFFDFITSANEHQLAYLGDTHLPLMFPGNIPNEAGETLSQVKDMRLSQQYLDFLRNQRFRSVLLCKAQAKLNRSLDVNDMKSYSFHYLGQSMPALSAAQLQENTPIQFKAGALQFTVTNSLTKQLLNELNLGRALPMSFDQLVKKSRAFQKGLSKKDAESFLLTELNLLRLTLAGLLGITKNGFPIHVQDTKKPLTPPHLRQQIAALPVGNLVLTNGRHQPIQLNPIQALLLMGCDGSRDTKALTEFLHQAIIERQVPFLDKDKLPIKPEQIKVTELKSDVEAQLKILQLSGFFTKALA